MCWNKDDPHGTYNTNSQTKFETSMLKPILCDYSDGYALVRGVIKIPNIVTAAAPNNRKNIKLKIMLYLLIG